MNRIISLNLIIGLIAVSCTDPNTIGLEVQPTSEKPFMEYPGAEDYIDAYQDFYEQFIEIEEVATIEK